MSERIPRLADLRAAGVATHLAPLAAKLMGMRVSIEHGARVGELGLKIAALVGERLPDVSAEIDRREKVFADMQVSSPNTHEHPRVAALESVLSDAVMGRF